ncbi:NADPH-adrenodoxin reductase [Dimargaris verticillata]|uniref:NADPH:adrenodoxin oxidoreductase, mitochondrial n=1 Tax=Dimargaris verticillata TaxID=2761393 RepID=A0A9W8EAL4_9FUNG|nr:NADPH-adrenodoxin reductase [Dimargaris verticillata]
MLPRLAIIGSGPAGFYTAARVLNRLSHDVAIDMFEKLPVPHGLVRYGVAPDHPEVKTVMNRFDEVAQAPNFRFFGNVTVGQDIALAELKSMYDGIVFAYGASGDRSLGLPEEHETRGVLSARSFVGWYNGHPDYQDLNIDLTSTDTAIVIGHGNVALDVARVLLSPINTLARTDITEPALEQLKASRVRHVHLVGRRGPVQVQFTTKELREMFHLPDVAFRVDTTVLDHELNRCSEYISKKRPLKRLLALLHKHASAPALSAGPLPSRGPAIRTGLGKSWSLDFLRSPKALVTDPIPNPPSVNDGHSRILRAIELEHNRLVGLLEAPRAEGTGLSETLETGLLLRSIGYQSTPLDHEVPFNSERHVIPNVAGRVLAEVPAALTTAAAEPSPKDVNTPTLSLAPAPGMYVSGWLKQGPVGIIVSTMNGAFETGDSIVADFQARKHAPHAAQSSTKDKPSEALCGSGHSHDALDLLNERGVHVVSYADWKRLEAHEFALGSSREKPREKIRHIAEMLDIIKRPL